MMRTNLVPIVSNWDPIGTHLVRNSLDKRNHLQ